MTNHFPLIEILALRGARINKKDKWGNTPLMLAISYQNHEAIHSLMKNGADPSVKNNYGVTALNKSSNFPNIMQFLNNFDEKKRGFPKFIVKLKL